jgi:hypothetical protein
LTHRYPEWRRFEQSIKSQEISRGAMDYIDFFQPDTFLGDPFKADQEDLEESKEIYCENLEMAKVWR